MNLWQTLKSELDGPFETVRRSISGALDVAEDLTRKGKIKLELQSDRNETRNLLAELGGRVHQLVIEDKVTELSGDTETDRILKHIKEVQEKIKFHETELDQDNQDK